MPNTNPLPRLTRAQFEEALKPYDADTWATGEGLIHRPEVMEIEGWNFYGSPGNDSLTEAQRVLMMWSDLVGQTANGGFSQFAYNYRANLALAWRLIRQLPWPELQTHFEAAFREQAGDPAAPRVIEEPNLLDEPKKWARNRRRLMRHLLSQDRPWWRPPSRKEIDAALGGRADWFWQAKYQQLVGQGVLRPDGEAVFDDWEDPPSEAVEAFSAWFYKTATKAGSMEMVLAFARQRQAELCQLID